MWSKKIVEINNPPMKKGQVMFVTDNTNGGEDEQYIKIATRDGYFNDFNYGFPAEIEDKVNEVLNINTDNGSIRDEFNVEVGKIYNLILDGETKTGSAIYGQSLSPNDSIIITDNPKDYTKGTFFIAYYTPALQASLNNGYGRAMYMENGIITTPINNIVIVEYTKEVKQLPVELLGFGTKTETVEILAEQTLTLDETEQVYFIENASDIINSIKATDKCNVVYNGISYSVSPVIDSEVLLGNLSYIGLENTGEPFLIMTEGAGLMYLMSPDMLPTITLSISTEQETVTTIPQKYLPEPVMFYTDGTYIYKDSELTEKALKDDIPKDMSFVISISLDELNVTIKPLSLTFFKSVGAVGVTISNGSEGGMLLTMEIYTAEYTG